MADEFTCTKRKPTVSEQIPQRRMGVGDGGDHSLIFCKAAKHFPTVLVNFLSRRSRAVFRE